MGVFLQQNNVSSPKPDRGSLPPDFMEAPQRREVFILPPYPKIFCKLLSQSEFLLVSRSSWALGQWELPSVFLRPESVPASKPLTHLRPAQSVLN
jgi:hypothetical protein